MDKTFCDFKMHLGRVRDLQMAASLLSWDRETFIPAGGVEARSRQLGTLSEMAHELFVADEVGAWLEKLGPFEKQLDFDSDDASLIRVTRREYAKQRRVPAKLVAEMARTASLGQQHWVEARRESNFARFRPSLAKLVDLRLQWAECFDYQDSIYDPMLDDFEPGLTSQKVEAIFGEFRPYLVDLVSAILEHQDSVDAGCLTGDFDESRQWEVGIEALKLIGFDFDHGRQDRSAHPFTTHFSSQDVRITTRFDRRNVASSLFSSIHEGGHALYEQGVGLSLDETLLGAGASMTLHESQSRLFENVIGRSRAFWRFFYPSLQRAFSQFEDVPLDDFYRAINQVYPSLIRVEADEVTYGLHIILRFELEKALVEGKLDVGELPDAWNSKMEDYLGLTPPDDSVGVLQDVHWSAGLLGYFPDYLLGSMLSVQLYDQALTELPNLERDLESGDISGIVGWLRSNVHVHGRKFTLDEITQRVLGTDLSPHPYLRYLRERYGSIYGL